MRVSEGYLDQRRDEIAQIAMRIYCVEGPDVSMAEICRAAGIAKGTIFRYFPSREMMFKELFESCREHARSMAAHPDDIPEAEANVALKYAIRRSFDWPLQFPSEFRYVNQYTDVNAFLMFAPDVFETYQFDVLDMQDYRDLFESMRRPEIPFDLASRMLASTVNVCCRYLLTKPDLAEDEGFLESLVETIYRSVFI